MAQSLPLKPNPKYFDSPAIPLHELRELLRTKAVLLPGLTVRFVDARSGVESAKEEVFSYVDGMRTYLSELSGEEPLTPPLVGSAFVSEGDANFAAGEGAEWAFAWYEGGDGKGRSFVNLIPTPADGTHVSGLRTGIFTAINNFIDHHSMRPKGLKLTADDTFRSVRFVLSGEDARPKL